ncbi:MAG: hypothetical protein SW833_16305 [Cyanobacteriota bacterium]|nr:hypothetical protein [Cyanobacteriota bacterium]
MSRIREIVQQIMTTGDLTLSAENQLRQLLQKTKYGREEIDAFVNLQKAVMNGQVKQQSRIIGRVC